MHNAPEYDSVSSPDVKRDVLVKRYNPVQESRPQSRHQVSAYSEQYDCAVQVNNICCCSSCRKSSTHDSSDIGVGSIFA